MVLQLKIYKSFFNSQLRDRYSIDTEPNYNLYCTTLDIETEDDNGENARRFKAGKGEENGLQSNFPHQPLYNNVTKVQCNHTNYTMDNNINTIDNVSQDDNPKQHLELDEQDHVNITQGSITGGRHNHIYNEDKGGRNDGYLDKDHERHAAWHESPLTNLGKEVSRNAIQA